MMPQQNTLRQLFHEVVFDCYQEHLGMDDAELSSYVADLLTEFTRAENLYRIRDAQGRPLREVDQMLAASDPVHGPARSFDAERTIRKHIGDYALFCTGMYPEGNHAMLEMVHAGKESYYIVSQFNLFEYASEAPLFARLAESFESCMFGLNKVRSELDRRFPGSPGSMPSNHTPRRLM